MNISPALRRSLGEVLYARSLLGCVVCAAAITRQRLASRFVRVGGRVRPTGASWSVPTRRPLLIPRRRGAGKCVADAGTSLGARGGPACPRWPTPARQAAIRVLPLYPYISAGSSPIRTIDIVCWKVTDRPRTFRALEIVTHPDTSLNNSVSQN